MAEKSQPKIEKIREISSDVTQMAIAPVDMAKAINVIGLKAQ